MQGNHATMKVDGVSVPIRGFNMPPLTTGEALLAAILANPDEDTPRLVYADWLQENDGEKHAELIRSQIAVARMGQPNRENLERFANAFAIATENLERFANALAIATELELPFLEQWSIEFFDSGVSLGRGFIEKVVCFTTRWLKIAPTILTKHPVQKVTLIGWDDDFLTEHGFSVTQKDGKSVWTSTKWNGIEFTLAAN